MLINTEAKHLNTNPRGHSERFGHSSDVEKDLGSSQLDPISCPRQEAVPSLAPRQHLLLAKRQRDRGPRN